MEKFYGNYLGICINNADPDYRGRVQIFIPHIMPALYEGWNKEGADKKIECVGDNLENSLSKKDIEQLKLMLPWAEAAAPLFGNSVPGHYNQQSGQFNPTYGTENQVAAAATASGSYRSLDTIPIADSRVKGIRGNNPGNLHTVGDPYIGQIGTGSDIGGNVAFFDTLGNGVAQNLNQIALNISRGQNTISSMAGSWTGTSGGTAAAVAQTWSTYSGIGVNEPLNFNNKAQMQALLQGISFNESSGVAPNFQAGFNDGWNILKGRKPGLWTGPEVSSSGSGGTSVPNDPTASPLPGSTSPAQYNPQISIESPVHLSLNGSQEAVQATPAATSGSSGGVGGGSNGRVIQNQSGAKNRKGPLSTGLIQAIETGLQGSGLNFVVFSGSQTGPGASRPPKASGRHDFGRAADGDFVDAATGRILNPATSQEDRNRIAAVLPNLRAAGIQGIGYDTSGYMGPSRFHLDIVSPAIWGSSRTSATAEPWVVAAVGGQEGPMVDPGEAEATEEILNGRMVRNPTTNQPTVTDTTGMPQGVFSVPNPGAMLWVFFREGDPLYPVYFAASFGAREWKNAYKATSQGGHYPGKDDTTPRNAALIAPSLAGGMSFVDTKTDDQDCRSVRIFHANGGHLEFHVHGSTLYQPNEHIQQVAGNAYNSCLNREDWTQGTNNSVTIGDRITIVGNMSQEVLDVIDQHAQIVKDINRNMLKNGGGGGGSGSGSSKTGPGTSRPHPTSQLAYPRNATGSVTNVVQDENAFRIDTSTLPTSQQAGQGSVGTNPGGSGVSSFSINATQTTVNQNNQPGGAFAINN